MILNSTCAFTSLYQHVKLPHSTAPICKQWNQTRNVNFFQKCKDSLGILFPSKAEDENLCEMKESVNSAQQVIDEITPNPDAVPALPRASLACGVKVVIIGAGMAGLSAANHLHKNGIRNITVLEALNRPGGRIQSAWFGDSIIELGSAIEKPPDTNPIVQKAFEDGLMKLPLNRADPSRGLLLRSDGSTIPFPVTYEVYNLFKEIWDEANIIEESGESRENKIKYISSRIEQEVRAFPQNFKIDAERVFHGLVCAAVIRSNHDNSFITTNNLGTYIQLPGSELQVPLGHFGEINTLYESLPKDDVKFGKSVIKIKWGGISSVFPKAVVICEGGNTYDADFVIITLPIGVLKSLCDSLFCPDLPISKLDAIVKIPIQHANKIFLQFSQPFWMWDKYLKFDPKSMQCRDGWIKGLDSIEPIQGSNHVMCLTVKGHEAQNMESISDKEVVCDIVTLFKQLTNNNVPDVVGIKRTSWSCNPQFLGAHSCMDCSVTFNDFFYLASPLPEYSEYSYPVLLFAGEATCPVHYGTVSGAKASGIREADRLIQLVRLQEEAERQCENSM